jgi:hypothetical protein
MRSSDRDGARRAMTAMLSMGKIEVDALERAYEGEGAAVSA